MPLQDQQGNYLELNTFLKVKGFAQTGGQAKLLIRNGKVKVNSEVELRNKRKLRDNDIVEINNKKLKVKMTEF